MLENVKSAILASQASTKRWEVQHSTTVLLKCLTALGEDHAYLVCMMESLNRLEAEMRSNLFGEHVSREEVRRVILEDIGDECVALVLGDDAAHVARVAAKLAATTERARKAGILRDS